MEEKIFRVTYDDGSETLYTAEELGSALADEPRLTKVIEHWDGNHYHEVAHA